MEFGDCRCDDSGDLEIGGCRCGDGDDSVIDHCLDHIHEDLMILGLMYMSDVFAPEDAVLSDVVEVV